MNKDTVTLIGGICMNHSGLLCVHFDSKLPVYDHFVITVYSFPIISSATFWHDKFVRASYN